MKSSSWRDQTTEQLIAAYATSRDPQLRDAIIHRHEKLVRSLAHKFARVGVPSDDLVQSAWVALIGALDRFETGHQARFSTYAAYCIVGEIKRYFRDKTWELKAPRRLQGLAARLNATHDRLIGELQREPLVSEMAAAMQVSEEDLLAAMDLRHAYSALRLDESREMRDGTDSMTISETVGGPHPELEQVAENAPLRAALGSLDARNQRIMRMRYFEGCSQQEVADAIGVSQMHVCRLERGALEQLRTVMHEPTG